MQNARQNSGSELKSISSVSNISDLRSFLSAELEPATQHSPSVTPSMALDPLIRLSDNLDRLEDMHKKLSFVMHEIRYSLKVK